MNAYTITISPNQIILNQSTKNIILEFDIRSLRDRFFNEDPTKEFHIENAINYFEELISSCHINFHNSDVFFKIEEFRFSFEKTFNSTSFGEKEIEGHFEDCLYLIKESPLNDEQKENLVLVIILREFLHHLKIKHFIIKK